MLAGGMREHVTVGDQWLTLRWRNSAPIGARDRGMAVTFRIEIAPDRPRIIMIQNVASRTTRRIHGRWPGR
jgi:hypothetical protein